MQFPQQQPPAGAYAPGVGLPSKQSLDYLKVGLEVLLLLLAVPWLLREFTRNPTALSRKAAEHHLKGG